MLKDNNEPANILATACFAAAASSQNGVGGPFGAIITDSLGEIIGGGVNTVLRDNDPTAHAEMNAIRQACQKISSHSLKGCILYTTAFPCPMCLSACQWAGISNIYYAEGIATADELNFKDKEMYEEMAKVFNADFNSFFTFEKVESEECKNLMKNYKGTIY